MLPLRFSNVLRAAINRNVAQVIRCQSHPFSFRAGSFSKTARSLLPKQKQSIISFSPLLRSRLVTTDAEPVVRPSSQESWKRIAVVTGTVAGTILVTEAFLNRDTRDTLSPTEQAYLHDSFKYTGVGLVITAAAARSMFRSGFAYRIMAANPWVVLGVSLVGSIGSMMGVFFTPPEKTVQKHICWTAFSICQGATLSPLFFLSPAILSRAALYTFGVVGALAYVGATARTDKYLYMGGPLLAGVTVVALSTLAPMALPMGMRGLVISEAISLYGGLAVFSGFVLYDTQKILQHARLAETGVIPQDPVSESISLELDMLNIFIRLIQLVTMSGGNKK